MTRNEVKRLQQFIYQASAEGKKLKGYCMYGEDKTYYLLDSDRAFSIDATPFTNANKTHKAVTIDGDKAFWKFFRHVKWVSDFCFETKEPTRYGTKYF